MVSDDQARNSQYVLTTAGVVWLIAGLSLAFRDYPSQSGFAEQCQRPIGVEVVMAALVLAASGVAISRTERWPSRGWWVLLTGLTAGLLVAYLVVAPASGLVCVN